MKAEFNKGIESLKNWNKVKDEKLGMENKNLKGKPHQQIRRYGRKKFMSWR